MIKPCTCASQKPHTQDELHGIGNRVWNHIPAVGQVPERWRCTVCGKEESKQSQSKK